MLRQRYKAICDAFHFHRENSKSPLFVVDSVVKVRKPAGWRFIVVEINQLYLSFFFQKSLGSSQKSAKSAWIVDSRSKCRATPRRRKKNDREKSDDCPSVQNSVIILRFPRQFFKLDFQTPLRFERFRRREKFQRSTGFQAWNPLKAPNRCYRFVTYVYIFNVASAKLAFRKLSPF